MRKRNNFLFLSALPEKEELPFYLVEFEQVQFKTIVQADRPDDVKQVIERNFWGNPDEAIITYVGYPHRLKKEKESWLKNIWNKLLTPLGVLASM